ncbi:TlpA family protein disulfide reductase [Massilia endophytica]|uniref:TlpA family protein disulfide reductase n=1 Tax=Massilia endophytica TaxID=2899220 RepID=UPI001E3220B5|nr:TlpA disulfide reductase family protein [Massilia endophytica]UGQ46413.1 TlpA family protein disulfide reductase [Massilia endophytica]
MKPRPLRLWRLAGAALLAAACLPAAAMHLTDVQGKAHTLEAYRGKWVVLNVWATWCAPCIKEMPELEALARTRSDVVVLGLAADGDNVVRIRQFAQALRVSYPIIAGNEELMKEFKVKAYPTTLLFDGEGKLVMTKMGQVTRAELDARLPAQAGR